MYIWDNEKHIHINSLNLRHSNIYEFTLSHEIFSLYTNCPLCVAGRRGQESNLFPTTPLHPAVQQRPSAPCALQHTCTKAAPRCGAASVSPTSPFIFSSILDVTGNVQRNYLPLISSARIFHKRFIFVYECVCVCVCVRVLITFGDISPKRTTIS